MKPDTIKKVTIRAVPAAILVALSAYLLKGDVWTFWTWYLLAMVLGIVTIVVSRIYVGVHYPSDVLGSMILGLAVLQFEYPLYDRLRFQWRFTGKQK